VRVVGVSEVLLSPTSTHSNQSASQDKGCCEDAVATGGEGNGDDASEGEVSASSCASEGTAPLSAAIIEKNASIIKMQVEFWMSRANLDKVTKTTFTFPLQCIKLPTNTHLRVHTSNKDKFMVDLLQRNDGCGFPFLFTSTPVE
jgi:hypothetical protein